MNVSDDKLAEWCERSAGKAALIDLGMRTAHNPYAARSACDQLRVEVERRVDGLSKRDAAHLTPALDAVRYAVSVHARSCPSV